jgi:NADPH2:quinone reductase
MGLRLLRLLTEVFFDSLECDVLEPLAQERPMNPYNAMQAIVLKSFGGPESFELCDVPKPVPHAGQVLVRVHATSINPLDYQVRRGDYPDLVQLPAITGHDVSGVVEEVGPGVTTFSPGDEVWYTPQIFAGPGSYADYHVAAESIIGKKPASLSHLEAASLTLVGGTVWEALIVRAALRVGESVLVHGGAGGVGHVAISSQKPWERGCLRPCVNQTLSSHEAWGPM